MEVRRALKSEVPLLSALIERSALNLCNKDYTLNEIEVALRGAWGVDAQLIEDQTYFVCVEGDRIVGCGGWSMRATLFGGDAFGGRDAKALDPKVDNAKIRAFFVDPDYVGRNVGLSILHKCETEALKAGFKGFELMATLTGARFYRRQGYVGDIQTTVKLDEEMTIMFIPMSKTVNAPARN